MLEEQQQNLVENFYQLVIITNQNFTPINITSVEGANLAIENITSALEYIGSMRATLGALENRLGYTIDSLLNQSVNVSAARSRIIDANMAVESAELVKKQILSQAGNFVLSAAFRNKNAVLGPPTMKILYFILLAILLFFLNRLQLNVQIEFLITLTNKLLSASCCQTEACK